MIKGTSLFPTYFQSKLNIRMSHIIFCGTKISVPCQYDWIINIQNEINFLTSKLIWLGFQSIEEKVSYEPQFQSEIDSSVTPISVLFSW